MRKTITYSSWAAMKTRCTNKRQQSWRNYGGRGIRVCERWNLFDNFLADMGERPSRSHTLEREDTNGNYEPANCKWVTRADQSRNTRRNIRLTFAGETLCLKDWAARAGLTRTCLDCRLFRYGWPLERALTESVGENQGRHRAAQEAA